MSLKKLWLKVEAIEEEIKLLQKKVNDIEGRVKALQKKLYQEEVIEKIDENDGVKAVERPSSPRLEELREELSEVRSELRQLQRKRDEAVPQLELREVVTRHPSNMQESSRTEDLSVPIVPRKRFEAIAAENRPEGYYEIGTAAGCPMSGYIRGTLEYEGTEYEVLRTHGGHGAMYPVYATPIQD